MNEEKVPEAGKEPIERSYQPATQDPSALLDDAPVTARTRCSRACTARAAS